MTPASKAIEAGALKPCPFCGNTRIELRDNGIGDVYAQCYSDDLSEYACGARMSDVRCETEAKAIRRWNTRPALSTGDLVPASAVAAERERCAQVAEKSYASENLADRSPKIIAAAIRAIPPTSDDYVMVPREPTEAMLRAGLRSLGWSEMQESSRADAIVVWHTMLEASIKARRLP